MGIISRLSAGSRTASRAYAGARMSRLTQDWPARTGSADSELWSSIAALRDRSRQLIRDNSYAKRAKLLVVNNVIGSGIGMQPKVAGPDGKLDQRINAAIEEAWDDWTQAPNCHTGGKLSFEDFERQAFGQIFEAGEVLPRKHFEAFGDSAVPLCLELVESERLADDFVSPIGASGPNYRMGIKRDEFGRPISFYLRKYHPGEFRYASGGDDPNTIIEVPAWQMMHLYICDRWPQTRGEPWLHAAMRRLNDMDGYSEAEIIRARAAACRVGIIQSPDADALPNDQRDPNAQPEFELEPGLVQRLAPGETWVESDPTSPNPNADPFMRLMLREVAAGIGVSYASMSMDYSQSNYSSSRLALLDDRDLWKVFQQFFIRGFRLPLHREWLRQAVLARAIPAISVSDYVANPKKYEAVAFKPRGWSWIDPSKDVESAIQAVRAGFTSVSQVIAQNGNGLDRDELWTEIDAERRDAEGRDLVFTSDAAQILGRGESDGNALVAQDPVPMGGPNQPKPEDAETRAQRVTELALIRQERMFEGLAVRLAEDVSRVTAHAVREAVSLLQAPAAPVVNNHISPQPVHVHTPDVHVDVAAPTVNVTTPDVKIDAPINVTTPEVKVDVPVSVNMPEQTVRLEMPRNEIESAEVVERDGNRLARVVRTNRGEFEIVERDANGDARVVKRRNAA